MFVCWGDNDLLRSRCLDLHVLQVTRLSLQLPKYLSSLLAMKHKPINSIPATLNGTCKPSHLVSGSPSSNHAPLERVIKGCERKCQLRALDKRSRKLWRFESKLPEPVGGVQFHLVFFVFLVLVWHKGRS
jgi:hypothetical protein